MYFILLIILRIYQDIAIYQSGFGEKKTENVLGI